MLDRGEQRVQSFGHCRVRQNGVTQRGVGKTAEHSHLDDSQDFARFKLMSDFYRRVPDILATMFDTVQPRSFEELLQQIFEEIPAA